jgi:hypothetical protein
MLPAEAKAFEQACGAVGELSEERVDEDAQHDDVDEEEFARLHGHITDPR